MDKYFNFTFYNRAKLPCIYATEFTATGNPITGMYCRRKSHSVITDQ